MKQEKRERELWARIIEDMRVRGSVSEFALEEYMSQLALREDTGTKLVIEYPKDLVMIYWIECNYGDYIMNSAARVLGGARSIEFVEMDPSEPVEESQPEAQDETPLLDLDFVEDNEGEQAEPAAPPLPAKRKPRRSSASQSFNSGLNEDYTFDNFIEGDNSRFACAAAQAVAASYKSATPGKQSTTLFIYGDSGLGKTHLLQAIGNAIRKKHEDAHVLYVTSEEFTNSYIDAIAQKGTARFRKKFRNADVLLIDDVQFLARKGKTQAEFFHTFNALFSSGKQIVLTADCPAANVINMDDRLVSRFEQGLSVMLQAPDYETRMAILRNKCKQWKSDLIGQDVLEFLAKNITRSVRRLEGALTCLVTFASFSHRRPSVPEARMQLKSFLSDEPTPTLTIKDIQQCVADEFNLRVADLNSQRRTAKLVHPRQIAMFLSRHHTGSSLQDIGAAFGGRNHGTVLHAMHTIEQKMQEDADLRATISRLLTTLGA